MARRIVAVGIVCLVAHASAWAASNAAPAAPKPDSGIEVDGQLLKVRDLPLIELPTIGRDSDTFAVFLSGDGGWGNLHKVMAAEMRRKGVPVVGWSCLRYLLKKRSPDVAGRDLDRVVKYYMAKWHKDKVILMGYSLGADVLPFMASRISKELRPRVSLVCPMGPSHQTEFKFHVTEWLNIKSQGEQFQLKPELDKLRDLHMNTVIIYGDKEKDSVVPLLEPGTAKLIMRKGKHHFDRNYRALANVVLEEAKPTLR